MLIIPAVYDNISLAYEGVGNIDKALESLHKSVAIKEKLFGEKHASVIESYKYICTLYYKQGRMDKVKEFFPKTYERVRGYTVVRWAVYLAVFAMIVLIGVHDGSSFIYVSF